MNHFFRCTAGLTLTGALLSGCTHPPTASELSLGKSVREALRLQAVNPQAARPAHAVPSTDGVVAAHGVDRYHQSHARPQPAQNVLNILASPASNAATNAATSAAAPSR